MLFDKPVTIDAALAHQHAKTVLPTALRAAEIRTLLSQQTRALSFFSAQTLRADYLSEAHKLIQSLVSGDFVVGGDGALRPRKPGEALNTSLVRTRMQNFLRETGYKPDPAERGGLLDLSSDRRVDLIIDTQTKMAQGYARHEAALDPEVLEDFPADEMYRQRQSKVKRDWDVTWNAARARLGDATTASLATSRDGPFVALKGDPIWVATNRFGNPWPPPDYNSGMWIRDADYGLAERLGVLRRKPRPASRPLADPAALKPEPSASMPPDLASALVKAADAFLKGLSS